MITPDCKREHNYSFKFLPVRKLADLLKELPEDHVVWCNAVGNLAIFKRVGEEQFESIGMVDFLFDGEVVFWNEP